MRMLIGVTLSLLLVSSGADAAIFGLFGKHKGRLIQEARKDTELRGWLDWLAKSANARNAKMGRWYLRQDKPLICADPR